MSIAATKEALIGLLQNKELKVIALSGAWGSGKTHLWKDVQLRSEDDQVRSAASTSLFGIREINALKMSAIQSAAFRDFQQTTTGRSVNRVFSAALKALKGAHASFGALDDLALLLLPTALKGKLVVIDDIERKHEDLTPDEILGFVDECCYRYGCRVLLILNEDRLKDGDLWGTFREKVIDAEVQLQTDPVEAFSIASQLTQSPYADAIRSVVEHHGVTNIRIIRRVIRACNQILQAQEHPHASTIGRVVPSVVLLGLAHFKGIKDPPDLDFALVPSSADYRVRLYLNREDRPWTPEEESENRWHQWLDRVGLTLIDELEAEIVKFYRSGLPNSPAISALLAANEEDQRRFTTQTRAREFFTNCLWYPSRTDASLVEELEQLIESVKFLDASTVTQLAIAAKELQGGDATGERLVDAWLGAFHDRLADSEGELEWYRGRRSSSLHPKIEAAVAEARGREAGRVGIAEACAKIQRDHAWGKTEENVLKNADVASYREAIEGAQGGALIAIMSQMLDVASVDLARHPHFGAAGGVFVEACRRVVAEAPEGRLSKLIVHLFKEEKLQGVLDPGR